MTGQNILRSTVTLSRKGFSEELFLAYVPSSKLLPNVFTKEFGDYVFKPYRPSWA